MTTDLSVYVAPAPVAADRPALTPPPAGWALVPAPAAEDLAAICSALNSPGRADFFTDSSAA
ncbi:hypothetical protein [Streptomyces sp. NRRL WC-3742]|uniref:hypothetical protein n=1 Tax=Streptomyces sp. NRRL WC-3742 TaxID=1463934 RepID=UPI000AB4412B|nr:hypothetical protein [Streptomyces sp. NRRL WC-3742]